MYTLLKPHAELIAFSLTELWDECNGFERRYQPHESALVDPITAHGRYKARRLGVTQ
jgi:hypothetical protein